MHLTEGRSTGIPKIRRAMKRNVSPPPVFETDKDRTCFLTILRIHPDVRMNKQSDFEETVAVTDRMVAEIDRSKRILALCLEPKSRDEIFKIIGLTNQTKNFRSTIVPLMEQGYLKLTIPDKPTSKKQKYHTTLSGRSVIKAPGE
jgi:ATP-dependent DNA helicase RecG